MSRAFQKERDDAPELVVVPRRSRASAVRLTPARRAELEARARSAASDAERAELADVLEHAVVVEPPGDPTLVGFGASVDVHGDGVGKRRFTIVGSDETDVAAGRISDQSPVGVALLGAHRGDVVVWHRPAGDVSLTIDDVNYDEATAGVRL